MRSFLHGPLVVMLAALVAVGAVAVPRARLERAAVVLLAAYPAFVVYVIVR
ncbi:MAG TPA: hypothetical protein VKH36_04365 [Acidimicrobiia bacterium]|nr:hypothetical protein [Acidimicrobiia bacterium]